MKVLHCTAYYEGKKIPRLNAKTMTVVRIFKKVYYQAHNDASI